MVNCRFLSWVGFEFSVLRMPNYILIVDVFHAIIHDVKFVLFIHMEATAHTTHTTVAYTTVPHSGYISPRVLSPTKVYTNIKA